MTKINNLVKKHMPTSGQGAHRDRRHEYIPEIDKFAPCQECGRKFPCKECLDELDAIDYDAF